MSRDIADRLPIEDGEGTNTDDGSAATTATADNLRSRIAAVERACTGDTDADLTDLADAAEATAELRRASTRLDDLESRVAELESATQALRGYVGSIRAVNERVERRADRALAATRETEGRDGPTRADPDRESSPPDLPDQEPSTAAREVPAEPNPSRAESECCGTATQTDPIDRADDPTDDDSPLVERLRDAL
ncbi:hypothetical protein GRX01_09425 [Halobaculum sp. WSA2]|uniref:DUF7310 domain-containing protein n=1 Tax=Halobaculum saliterrae TaxID=2073113 RepID=A0A6B0SVB3_9EURY|nr:hypothetical protein [Halobaculum saliterrae]MXR41556.1 hypothetical protein [Halobaculum saliterrae]